MSASKPESGNKPATKAAAAAALPVDIDKAYVKKNKINDMLNELFLAIAQQKPANPLEFALKHFEAKLPERSKEAPTAAHQPSIPSPIEPQAESAADPLSLAKTNNFNMMNKIHRMAAAGRKARKELTSEELLENERIVFVDRREDDDADEENNANAGKLVSFKSNLRERETIANHKQSLQALIESVRVEQASSGSASASQREDELADATDKIDLNEEEQDELDNELLVVDDSGLVTNKRKKKKKPVATTGADSGANVDEKPPQPQPPHDTTPLICAKCSKILTNADSIDMSNMPKDTDRSKKAVNNNNNNNNSVNNFFDLFHSATMQSAQQQPQITDRALNLDDDVVESASQVSGPRPMTPFEAPTARDIGEQTRREQEALVSAGGDGQAANDGKYSKEAGVLAWVMSRQTTKQPQSGSALSQTSKGAPARERTSPSTLVNEEATGANGASTPKSQSGSQVQHWNQLGNNGGGSSSASEASFLAKLKKK